MQNLDDRVFLNRKILVTGHTGFKGAWLCLLLKELGADIYGYALEPPTNPSLFIEAKIDELITSEIGDIRNYKKLFKYFQKVQPEIVIHMAAQPLVRESYKNPVETFSTNIMGTVYLLEACRKTASVRSVVNVTTDKCYENKEWRWGYRENEPMGGHDPYSSSKACSELVTAAYSSSYFNSEDRVALATARAGNVIGGGDWADDRLIPDFIRSISKNEKLLIRSPYAIRPWQHVLEPLSGYLILAQKMFQYGDKYAGAWNFGPNDSDAQNVEWITNNICCMWGEEANYEIDDNPHPHEANYLKLDCSKAKAELSWYPKWDIQTALKSIVDWNKAFTSGQDIRKVTIDQINRYFQK